MEYDGISKRLHIVQMPHRFHVTSPGNQGSITDSSHTKPDITYPMALILVSNFIFTIISAFLIYGCAKNRPTLLLPFFGVQLFDFFHKFSSFIDRMDMSALHEQRVADGPFMNALTTKDRPNTPRYRDGNSPEYGSVMFTMLVVLLYKFYFILVVWKCYKYLRLKELADIPNIAFRTPLEVI